MKTYAFGLAAWLLLMSHNAGASPLAMTPPTLSPRTSSLLISMELWTTTSARDGTVAHCPAVAPLHRIFEKSKRGDRSCSACTQTRGLIERQALASTRMSEQLVDEWWDAARKVTLDF